MTFPTRHSQATSRHPSLFLHAHAAIPFHSIHHGIGRDQWKRTGSKLRWRLASWKDRYIRAAEFSNFSAPLTTRGVVAVFIYDLCYTQFLSSLSWILAKQEATGPWRGKFDQLRLKKRSSFLQPICQPLFVGRRSTKKYGNATEPPGLFITFSLHTILRPFHSRNCSEFVWMNNTSAYCRSLHCPMHKEVRIEIYCTFY